MKFAPLESMHAKTVLMTIFSHRSQLYMCTRFVESGACIVLAGLVYIFVLPAHHNSIPWKH